MLFLLPHLKKFCLYIGDRHAFSQAKGKDGMIKRGGRDEFLFRQREAFEQASVDEEGESSIN